MKISSDFCFSKHEYLNRFGKFLIKVKPEITDITPQLSFLPADILKILKQTGITATENNCKIYLIGGMIRDLLLKKTSYDLDFVVDGNLKQLLPELAGKLNGDWKYREEFATGKITLASGYNLDLATTRREYYPSQGALPQIERTNICEDLFRRDYTVNALALALAPDDFGELIDFFKGRDDIKNQILRVLHSFSFLDDPTRIIRGIRLAVKLDFSLEPETRHLMVAALEQEKFPELSPERVFKEIKLLFKCKTGDRFIQFLQEIPCFRLLNINLKISQNQITQLKELGDYLAYFRKKHYNIKEWLLKLAVFLRDIPETKINKWNLPLAEKRLLTFSATDNKYNILKKNKDSINPVKLYNLLNDLTHDEMILLILQNNHRHVVSNIKLYLEELSQIELNIDGHDILELGLQPGPEIKSVLARVWKAKAEGRIDSRSEELAYAGKLIKNGCIKPLK